MKTLEEQVIEQAARIEQLEKQNKELEDKIDSLCIRISNLRNLMSDYNP